MDDFGIFLGTLFFIQKKSSFIIASKCLMISHIGNVLLLSLLWLEAIEKVSGFLLLLLSHPSPPPPSFLHLSIRFALTHTHTLIKIWQVQGYGIRHCSTNWFYSIFQFDTKFIISICASIFNIQ